MYEPLTPLTPVPQGEPRPRSAAPITPVVEPMAGRGTGAAPFCRARLRHERGPRVGAPCVGRDLRRRERNSHATTISPTVATGTNASTGSTPSNTPPTNTAGQASRRRHRQGGQPRGRHDRRRRRHRDRPDDRPDRDRDGHRLGRHLRRERADPHQPPRRRRQPLQADRQPQGRALASTPPSTASTR